GTRHLYRLRPARRPACPRDDQDRPHRPGLHRGDERADRAGHDPRPAERLARAIAAGHAAPLPERDRRRAPRAAPATAPERHAAVAMLLGEIVRVALEALRANKLRSLLTMLGIIIGVGAVITMIPLGSGAHKSVQDRIQALGPTLLSLYPGQSFMRGIAS